MNAEHTNPTTRIRRCACSRPAVKIKHGEGVCERCDRLEARQAVHRVNPDPKPDETDPHD